MAKRFEKKETDKSEIKQEEKKIGIIKNMATIACAIFGTAVLIFTNGKNDGTTKS